MPVDTMLSIAKTVVHKTVVNTEIAVADTQKLGLCFTFSFSCLSRLRCIFGLCCIFDLLKHIFKLV